MALTLMIRHAKAIEDRRRRRLQELLQEPFCSQLVDT